MEDELTLEEQIKQLRIEEQSRTEINHNPFLIQQYLYNGVWED
jgi:hypothetical protein